MPKTIVATASTLNGNPHIQGTRLTVFDVVSACEHEGIGPILEESKDLSIGALRSVFKYCGSRRCDQEKSYCGGCSLRQSQDGVQNVEDFINLFAEVRFSRSDRVLKGTGSGIMYMPGTPEELPDNWRGEDGWMIASDLLEKLQDYSGQTAGT